MARFHTLLILLVCEGIAAKYVRPRSPFDHYREILQTREALHPRTESEAFMDDIPETHVPNRIPLAELERALETQDKMPSRLQTSRDSEGPVAWYEPENDDVSDWSYDSGECVDKSQACQKFADNYQCYEKQYEKWMNAKCKATCGFCKCWETKYGCCEDGKTPADGPAKAGCGMKLCVDQRSTCDKYKAKGDCDDSTITKKYKTWLENNCASTCRYCQKGPSPKDDCEARQPIYGCCWNGDEATGFNNQGCIPCEDMHPRTCKLYKSSCESTFYKDRKFMDERCPKTCGRCGACSDKQEAAKCDNWKNQGLCNKSGWRAYMAQYCAMSCGFCTNESVGVRSYLGL